MKEYKRLMKVIVEKFDQLPLLDIQKPRVGVVGEILVKYHPNANNDIVNIIESEGGEAVVLDLADFFLYGMYSKEFNYRSSVRYVSGYDDEQGGDRSNRTFPQADAKGTGRKQ